MPVGLLELALQGLNFHHVPLQQPFLVWNAKQDQRLHDDQSLHRLDADLLWSPRPGALVSPEGSERIDEFGLRGFDAEAWNSGVGDSEARDAPGAVRMATLGDSSTFGWGVAWKESWSARAADDLREAQGRPVATLGGGVIGYTVAQGRRRFARDVAPRGPSVTVLAFGAVNEHFASDLSDVERIDALRERLSWRRQAWKTLVEHSRTAQGLAFLAEQARGGREQILSELRAELEAEAQLQQGFERADYSGPRRVPLSAFEAEYRALVEDVRRAGSLPVILRMPRRAHVTAERTALSLYDEALVRIAAETGTLFVDASDVIAEEEEAELFFDAFHPKPEGHRRIGERVAQALVAHGV